MAAVLILHSSYSPGPPGDGTVTLRLENRGPEPLEGFRLALTSTVQLDPDPTGDVTLARRLAGYHELAPPSGLVLGVGDELSVAGMSVGHALHHANDGPESAFVILADGSALDVELVPTTCPHAIEEAPRELRPSRRVADPVRALVPWPATIDVAAGGSGSTRLHRSARLESSSVAAGGAVDVWRAVAAAERRLHAHGPWSLSDGEDGQEASAGGWVVRISAAAAPPGHYELTLDDGAGDVVVAASDDAGFRHAFVTLAQLLREGAPARVRIVDGPFHEWRGLHVDLARQFFRPHEVERIVDLAAWRKLDRLHLHLSDDEGWRVPIDGYPELTDVGAWRGHGLAIPPLNGSPASPSGGSYTVEEIRRWVRRGAELGVSIVPEVDLPGHCHAALTAVPSLRDPGDVTGAHSVQHFVDNSLCPGLPTTMPFVEAVFGSLADLFDARWLHVGGDEVAPGAWARSPVAQAFAAARGVRGTDAIEATFMADVIAAVRRTTGRQVGAWQELAEHGGLAPSDGYVVAWKSAADAQALADAGFDVVVSAPDAYYLDMALDERWSSPGASWAGAVGLDDVCAFEPGAGWSDDARRHLLGVQACVWTEHIRSVEAFDELVFPRLDAIAERAWSGRIEGGARSLAERASAMPTLGNP